MAGEQTGPGRSLSGARSGRFHDWIDPGMERGYVEYLFKRRARGGTDNAGSRVPLATEPSSPAGG